MSVIDNLRKKIKDLMEIPDEMASDNRIQKKQFLINNYPIYHTINFSVDEKIATIELNRPEVHNAYNNEMVNELFDVFEKLNEETSVRVIVITGAGKSFCSGADLQWMKNVVNHTYEENYKESLMLAKLMFMIYTHNKPIIAKVNGSAFGGGVGLLSVCDIVVALDTAEFGFKEVRLGLVPAVISPFIISRIHQTFARELFITGENITAQKALQIGLANEVCSHDKFEELVSSKVQSLLKCGPEAVKVAKHMLFKVSQIGFPVITDYTAELNADMRLSKEAQEGMNAFLEKRNPSWLDD